MSKYSKRRIEMNSRVFLCVLSVFAIMAGAVPLVFGAAVSGKVVDKDTQAPLEGVCIVIYKDNPCTGTIVDDSIKTSAGGGFGKSGLSAGTYYFLAVGECITGDYYLNRWYASFQTSNCKYAESVVLGEETIIDNIDIQLEGAAKVSATIKNDAGEPLEGVEVLAISSQCTNETEAGKKTDAAGLCSFYVKPGTYYFHTDTNDCTSQVIYAPEWWAGGEGGGTYDCYGAGQKELAKGEDFSLTLRLDEGAEISGNLTQAGSGEPIVNMCVYTYSEICSDGQMFTTVSGADGSYSFALPANESYYVIAVGDCPVQNGYDSYWWNSEGLKQDCSQAEEISLSAGSSETGIDFSMGSGVILSGSVTSETGNPLNLVSVKAYAEQCGDSLYSGITNQNGMYSLDIVPGDYYLYVNPQEGAYSGGWWTATGGLAEDCTNAEPLTVSENSTQDFQLQAGFALEFGISQIRTADDSLKTFVMVRLPGFPGTLPGGVDSITIKQGETTLWQRNDLAYSSNVFSNIFDGAPQTGQYTCTVITGDAEETATDSQTTNRELPIPDTAGFTPKEGDSHSGSTFSWEEVSYSPEPGLTLAYRIEILDDQDTQVYASDYENSIDSHTLSSATLTTGENYRFRVLVADATDWMGIQNEVMSQYVSFTQASVEGDLSGDGDADLEDLILALFVLSGKPNQVSMSGDLTGDQKIDGKDVLCLLQKIAGLRQ